MNIIACVKQVVDCSVPLEIDVGAKDISHKDVAWVLNPADLSALRLALSLRRAVEKGRVTVVSVGPGRVDSVLRNGLAFGADRAVRLDVTQASLHNGDAIALLLAAAVRWLEGDVVFCGDHASDTMGGQTAIALAAALEWPVVSSVTEALVSKAGAGSLVLQRRLDGGWRQVIEIDLPVVIKSELEYTVPEYPSLPLHIRSIRATVTKLSPLDLGISAAALNDLPLLKLHSVSPPKPRPKKIFTPDSNLSAAERMKLVMTGEGGQRKPGGSDTIEGSAREAAAAILEQLRQRKAIQTQADFFLKESQVQTLRKEQT